MAKISVVIVNYNTGKLLTKAVQSVIKFPDVEVIVVDNASQDHSLSSLISFVKSTKLKIIKNSKNLGFAKAVNQAVKQAKGNYIYLLNSDATITKSSLAQMVQTALNYDNNCIVVPRLTNPDGSPQSSCYQAQTPLNAIKEFWLNKRGSYSKYLPSGKKPTRVHAAVAAAWLVPIKVWKRIGGLSEKYFLYFEDLDFCNTANKLDIPVIYDPKAQVKHHHGVSAKTNLATSKLIKNSALLYHGRLKKHLLDAIILTPRLFTGRLTTKKLLIIYLLWMIALKAIASLGYFLLPSRYAPLSFISSFWKSNFLLWSWANFDGEHYLSIAKFGYQVRNTFPQYAFFPLYPGIIKALSLLTKDFFLSAKIITIASGYAFLHYLRNWLNIMKIKNITRIVLLTLIFPGAVFLHAIYTESLFLALVACAFYHAQTKNWKLATLATALATATRVNGIILVAFLAFKLIKSKLPKTQVIKYLLLSSSGLITYMAYLWVKTGNALAFYFSQYAWGKAEATSPITTIIAYAKALTTEFTLDLVHLTVLVEVAITIWMIYLLIRSLSKSILPFEYALYSLLTLALPITTGSLGSMPRFSLLAFPLFIYLANIPSKKLTKIIFVYILTLTFGTILFTRGYWYA